MRSAPCAFSNAAIVHTPRHASWLNQAEVYFSIIQPRLLSPHDFENLGALTQGLADFKERYNQTARPFGMSA